MNIYPPDYEILIVDDIPSNVILLKAILIREKYRIVTAYNGRDALAIIEKKAPDMVLLDVMMPEMSGLEVCQYIRKELNLRDLPVIMLTALNSNEDIIEGFSAGANDFVSKPFNNDVLLMRIRFQLSVISSTRIIMKQSEELAATIASRDTLYSVIAHDLRSPLATIKMIMNYVAPLIQNTDMDDDIKEMLETANSISEDAFNLFDNLLKWTKSQTGRLKYVPQKVEASEITASAIEIQVAVANGKGITLKTFYPEKKVEVEVDIDMFKTVFRNLLSNAIKFSQSGSEIDISVTEEEDRVVFSVTDHGCGMNQESIDKIVSGKVDFTKAGTKNESGSGLGLNLARDFIIRNGGALSVTSEEGVGSTFSFYVPKTK